MPDILEIAKTINAITLEIAKLDYLLALEREAIADYVVRVRKL